MDKRLPHLVAHRTPQEIMDEIAAPDAESAEVLAGINSNDLIHDLEAYDISADR